jgi:hypothetical protein
MKRLARRAVPVYVALLLLLSAVGMVNQGLYRRQVRLMDVRSKLMDQIAGLRLQAATVNGPLAVTHWADAHGMVPAPEASNLSIVASGPRQAPPPPAGGLEIRTVWR